MPSYQVQPGDTLYDIAEKTTGDGNRWREIYDNNQETVGGDPGMIRPGQVLAIPYNDPVASQNTGRPNDNMTVPQRYSQPSPDPSFGPAVSPYADQGSGNAGYPGIAPQSPQKERWQPPVATPPQQMAPAGSQGNTGYKFVKNQYVPSATQNSQYPYASNYNGPKGQQQGPRGPGDRPTQVPLYRQSPYNQVAPSEAAKYGVTITPPIQQGINAWQQSKPPMQYEQQSPYSQQAPRPSGPVERQGGPIGATTRGQVTWPAPPRSVQPQSPGVSPASYGGRFTDAQGNLVAPTVGSYMGKQPQAYQPPPPQQGAAPSAGAWQGAPPPSFQGQARWQAEEQPRAIVVIANDGSQMVYDTQTGQWKRIEAAPTGTKGRYSARPPSPPTQSPYQAGVQPGFQQRQMQHEQPTRTLAYDGYTYNQVTGGYPPDVTPPSSSDFLRDLEYVPPFGMREGRPSGYLEQGMQGPKNVQQYSSEYQQPWRQPVYPGNPYGVIRPSEVRGG